MTATGRFVSIAFLGGGLLAAGYGGWVASRPDAVKTTPASTNSSKLPKDDAVVLEVLEGVFKPRSSKVAGSVQPPEEQYQETLHDVATRRGLKVADLQGQVQVWIQRIETLNTPDAYQLALAMYQSGDYQKAAASATTAYTKAMQIPQGSRSLAERAAMVRAQSLMALQKYAEALPAYENAAALTNQKTETLSWIQTQEARAFALFQLNRFPEMVTVLRQAIEARAPVPLFCDQGICYSLTFLAEAYRRQQLLPEAETALQEALDRMSKLSVVSPTVRFEALCTLAQVTLDLRRPNDAIPYVEQAMKISDSTGRLPGIDPGRAPFQMGNIYKVLKQPEDAVRWYKLSAESYQKSAPDLTRRLALVLSSMGNSLADLGRFDEAVTAGKQAVEIMKKAPPGFEFELSSAYGSLGSIYNRAERFTEAEPVFRQGIQEAEASFGPDSTRLAPMLGNLAFLLWREQRLDEAEPLIWDAVGMDFRSAVAMNQIPRILSVHLQQFGRLMADRGISNDEARERVRQLAIEAKMTPELFAAAMASTREK